MSNPSTTIEIIKMRKKIFYHILAWIEDEGKYQPTQEEAEKAVDDILLSLLKRVREEERVRVRFELHQLDWIKILSTAIKARPTSWGKDVVREWRNASDEIVGAMMTEAEKKGIFRNPFKKLGEDKGGLL